MRCFVCNSDDWVNVDKFRLKPSEMHMCNTCGVVSYPKKYKSKEEILAYYRKDYRKPPNVSNLYTGERKLHYHQAFLGDIFDKWKAERGADFGPLVIGEVGAAYGVFLNWLKSFHFPDAEVYGTELTTSYRRVAFHEYGLRLAEDLPEDKKYDLIASYHVLEHMQDPDLELKRYRLMLKPGGYVYLSTPIWFREATNFGTSGFDIEYYWHPDHINGWGEEHLEWIIEKAGLKIVRKNDDIYGNTYLLQAYEDVKNSSPHPVRPWNPQKNLERLDRLYRCWKHLQENETALAIEAWPNCPTAWINHYESNRAAVHKEGFEKIKTELLEKAMTFCPNTADACTFAGDVAARYEQFDVALGYFQQALNKKPNNPTILMAIGNCLRQKSMRTKDEKEKAALLAESMDVCRFVRQSSMEMAGQATTFVYHDAAQIPFEGE